MLVHYLDKELESICKFIRKLDEENEIAWWPRKTIFLCVKSLPPCIGCLFTHANFLGSKPNHINQFQVFILIAITVGIDYYPFFYDSYVQNIVQCR